MHLKDEEVKAMGADNVFAFYHKNVIADNYFTNQKDKLMYNCEKIAMQLAIALIDENYELCMEADKGPEIFAILDLANHNLVPQQLSGHARQAHYVCEFQGKAYDPLLPEPILVEEYDVKVFGKTIKKNRHMGTSNILRFHF